MGLSCTRSPAADSVPTQPPDTSRSLLGFATVSINPPAAANRIEQVQLFPRTVTAVSGQRIFFTAVALDHAGRPVPARLQFRVRNQAVGAISQNGLLLVGQTAGLYNDVVEVTARDGERLIQALGSVEVLRGQAGLAGRLQNLVVYPRTVIVQPGQTVGLGALGWDETGRFVQNLEFRWVVSNPAAGRIDQFGFFTGGAAPEAFPDVITVTATQRGATPPAQLSATVSVIVRVESVGSSALGSLIVIPGGLVLAPGQQGVLTARAFDHAGHEARTVRFDWKASPEAGSFSRPGLFVAAAQAGVHPEGITVTAVQDAPSGPVVLETHAAVTVRAIVNPRLSQGMVFPETATVLPGRQLVFTASGQDAAGSTVPAVATWSVTDPRAGTITGEGIFTSGRLPGTYKDALRVQLNQRIGGEEFTALAFATVVVPGALERLEIQPDRAELGPGEALIFKVVGYDAQGVAIPQLRTRWSVTDPTIGRIDQAGVFVAGSRPGIYLDAIKVSVTSTS